MRQFRRGLLWIGLAWALAGCVGFTLAKKGEPVEIASKIAITPGRDWNRLSSGDVEIWTLDGLHLQQMAFVGGIGDGEPLFASRIQPGPTSDADDGPPKFRKGMTALEIAELFEASLARQQAQRIAIAALQPARFGGRLGFSFDFTYVTKDGLEMKGRAAGAVVEDRLYMAIYRGARLHFYDRGADDFHQVLGSLRFL
ncbi:MAG TPA: hypothetical protein VGC25_04755 [Alphaproteobacteria bacterium]